MDESDLEDEELMGEEESDEELDPNNPDDAFKILERDFNKTLAQLESQPDAIQYADEFAKIFEAAFKLKIREGELTEENAAMSETIADQESKLDLARDLANKDKDTIDELKKNINHVCKMADAAHFREQAAQEIIDNLRKQVETLNAEIDFKNKMATDEDAGKSHKEKDLLQREKERLTTENNYLQQKLENCNIYTEELEEKTGEANLKINELSSQVEDQASEIDRMKKFREKLEEEITLTNTVVDEKEIKINQLNGEITQLDKRIVEQSEEAKNQKMQYMKINKDFVLVEAKYSKLFNDHQKVHSTIDQAKKDLQSKVLDLKAVTDEVVHLKADYTNLSMTRDSLEKQMFKQVQASQQISEERNLLRQKVATIEKEIQEQKKEIQEHKKVEEDAVKEKNNIVKQVTKATAVNKEQARLIKVQQKTKEKLETDLDLYFIENNRQKKEISNLQLEKDRYAEAQIQLNKKIDDLMEDVRQKKVLVFDLKRTITEHINKIRQQQNLYEAVRAEKSSLQKSLEQCSADSEEVKKKLKITLFQTEQLKEDISSKEQELIKQDTTMRKVIKERENLKVDVDKGLEQIMSLKNEIKEMQDEEKRLRQTISTANKKIREQSKTIEQLMNERDVLGSQLVRRNDELALNNDKIKILVTTLHRGEAQYDQRLGDIRLLKIEVKRLRQEKLLMEKSVMNMIDFRQEVFRLERDLTTTKLKCRALEEELHNPVNVHRWRKLEGSDPDTLELLQKIKILQKRLLKQSYDAIEREKQLKESEQLYLKFKEVLAHQPGPTIREDLNRAQKGLKIKDDKLKVLVSELNMAELRSTEYKSQLEKITEELKEIKMKYIQAKKENRMRRMGNAATSEIQRTQGRQPSEIKFTGGGYRMSVVPQISLK